MIARLCLSVLTVNRCGLEKTVLVHKPLLAIVVLSVV